MKISINQTILSIALFIGFSINAAFAQEQEAVSKCFDNYKTAVLAEDGIGATALLSQETIDYYQQVLDWALTASEQEVKGLSILDRMNVLTVRVRVTPEQMKEMDGESLLVFSYTSGIISKNTVERGELGKVEIDGDNARGPIMMEGQEVPIDFVFAQEKGAWKFDLLAITKHEKVRQGFERAVSAMDKDENDVLLEMIKVSTDLPVTKNVWKPVGK